jgi:acyl-CoA synthetase (AMP-forming)/AMP-acid ligase II
VEPPADTAPPLSRHAPDDLVAVGVAGDRTAAHLAGAAARIAEALPGGGARDVLVVAEDRYQFAAALLGAWAAGHRVALPPNAQGGAIRALADRAEVCTILHDTHEDIGVDVRTLTDEGARDWPAPTAPAADAPAVLMYTSGSAGEPAAHSKTFRQLAAEARVLAERFEIGPGARVLGTVPSHHVYGLLFALLVPLGAGAAFVREAPLHAPAVHAALERHRARVLVSVPAHLRALAELPSLSALDLVVSSGAPLMPEVALGLRERHGVIVTEVLGSTETGGIASRRTDAGPAWTPLPRVRIAVDDDGRLAVDSPFLPPGLPRPHPSQDRVEPRPDGTFLHLGRLDDVVKVAGKRVALGEIERRLAELPGVEDVAVLAVPAAGGRGQATAALAVAPGWSPEALRTRLRRTLDPVVVPRRIRLLDAIPRDERGKLPRERALAELERRSASRLELEVAPGPATGDPTRRRFDVRAPRDLYWFRGHFTEYPLVPGVVQLELVRALASEAWPELAALGRVLRLKFKRPIRPGDRLELRLRRIDGRPQVEFELVHGDAPASSGVLEFGPRSRA